MTTRTSILKTSLTGTLMAGGLASYIDRLAKNPLFVLQATAVACTTVTAVATIAMVVLWIENRKADRIADSAKLNER